MSQELNEAKKNKELVLSEVILRSLLSDSDERIQDHLWEVVEQLKPGESLYEKAMPTWNPQLNPARDNEAILKDELNQYITLLSDNFLDLFMSKEEKEQKIDISKDR